MLSLTYDGEESAAGIYEYPELTKSASNKNEKHSAENNPFGSYPFFTRFSIYIYVVK